MSVSLLLIPAALAAVAAVGATGATGIFALGRERDEDRAGGASGATGGDGPLPVQVQTRMKDPDLLTEALRDLGALEVSETDGEIVGVVDGVRMVMSRTPDEVWAAHFTRDDGHEVTTSEAQSLIERLDSAYALRVQHAVAERIRARAATSGFELVSETRDDDDTITMVLDVKDYA